MTRPEQPKPYPGDLIAVIPGAVPLRRTYRDALGRPMTGSVTITGTERHDHGEVVIPGAASVTVAVVDGTLAKELPPDTYRIAADLRTRDGSRWRDTETVTLE